MDHVVPFAAAASRRFRRPPPVEGEPVGRILLFTGVRYERMPEAGLVPDLPKRRHS